MKYLLIFAFCLPLIVFGSNVIVQQSDWMGGDGVFGPVTEWGTKFYRSDSVTTATAGNVALVATAWDYTKWERHIIVLSPDVHYTLQGFMAVDIDKDLDKDLIAYVGDSVFWFENVASFVYLKHAVGYAPCASVEPVATLYPADVDTNGDIDILVATNSIGAGWFENIGCGASWRWHVLDNSIGYHRICAADVDNDKDIDIIAVDNSRSNYWGEIILFRNVGGTFSMEIATSVSGIGFWRVYPADFNGDGFVDLYSVNLPTSILLNDGTGHFFNVYYQSSRIFDGAWPSDIDRDGDLDLVVAGSGGFWALLNDGSGHSFSVVLLSPNSNMIDGSMTADIDMDGFPDIVGSYVAVGWLRQNPLMPMTFTTYTIDRSPPYSIGRGSHWIYVDDVDCGCAPDMDLLNTGQNAHIIYENKMIQSYASIGYLESSVIDAADTCLWYRIGWDACVPHDTAIAFYWRVGNDITTFSSLPWNGPIYGAVGNGLDSINICGVGRYFQYKVEFRRGINDIAVLRKFWAEYTTKNVLLTGLEFSEETYCDNRNMVQICYSIYSIDSTFLDVSVKFSIDGGLTWTIPPLTVSDAEGDIGINVAPGEHCFYWSLSTDVPGIEGREFLARIIASNPIGADTAYYTGPLDSKPPEVNVFTHLSRVSCGDSIAIYWTVNDTFWSYNPAILIATCGSWMDTMLVLDTSLIFYLDIDSMLCDSVRFKIEARDSFCNWGYDIHSVKLLPPSYVNISFGDTIVKPCENAAIPLYVNSTNGAIDELVINFVVDTSVIRPINFVPTITPAPDSVVMRKVSNYWQIKFFWPVRMRINIGIAGFLNFRVNCSTSAGYFSIVDIISAYAHRANVYWRNGSVIVDYKIHPWLVTLHIDDLTSEAHTEVTFGANYGSTDGYDPWIDLLHLAPPPGVIDAWFDIDDPSHPAVRKLYRDVRDMVVPDEWHLVISHPSSVRVHWRHAALGEGFYTINGFFDMRSDTQYFAAPFETLTITWDLQRLYLDTVRMYSGWNLISIPLRCPRPYADFIFGHRFYGPYQYDPISKTFFIPNFVGMGRGYYVYSARDTILVISGVRFPRYKSDIFAGWNLLGCPSFAVDTASVGVVGTWILGIFELDSTGSYVVPDSLRPGKGYWFLVPNDGKIYVPR